MSLVDQIHALLFVSEAPAKVADMAVACSVTEGQIEQALEILEARLEEQGPVRIIKIAGGHQIATKAEFAEIVARYTHPHRGRLSKSLMEVLAMVAYKQPITGSEIELIRGVQSDYSLRALVEKRLIHEVGRRNLPGRPIEYGTTQQFLHQFNIHKIEDLPPILSNEIKAEISLGGPI